MLQTPPFRRFPALVLLLLFSSGAVHARDYLVEVVLFETIQGKASTSGGLYYPKISSAMELNSDTARAAGFVPIEDGLTLTENAAAIAASGRYRLLNHMAWRQPGLDDKNALAIRISLGNTMPLYLPDDINPYDDFIPADAESAPERSRQVTTTVLNGTIKVRLGRFLHMDALLVYTDSNTQQSFRLSQSRKMRSLELHYIDNPRFGILTRILPIEDDVIDSSDSSGQPG